MMQILLSFIVLLAGTGIVLHPHINDGVLLKIAVSSAASCAGAFILGGDQKAFGYMLASIVVASLIHLFERVKNEILDS